MSGKIQYDPKKGGAVGAKKAEENKPEYKTEEMLKQEARERLTEQARIEAAQPPKSERSKKIDNFFYHYKWHTILIITAVVVAAFFIRDLFFRSKPDLSLVVASSRFLLTSETDALQAELEKYATDFNGDGKIVVNLDNIHLPLAEARSAGSADQAAGEAVLMQDGVDPQVMQASAMKLMAIIAAGDDLLFLADDEIYSYMLAMGNPQTPDDYDYFDESADAAYLEITPEFAVFETLEGFDAAFGPFNDRLAIKDTVLADVPGMEYIGDLAFSLRPPQSSKQASLDRSEFCKQLLSALTTPAP